MYFQNAFIRMFRMIQNPKPSFIIIHRPPPTRPSHPLPTLHLRLPHPLHVHILRHPPTRHARRLPLHGYRSRHVHLGHAVRPEPAPHLEKLLTSPPFLVSPSPPPRPLLPHVDIRHRIFPLDLSRLHHLDNQLHSDTPHLGTDKSNQRLSKTESHDVL